MSLELLLVNTAVSHALSPPPDPPYDPEVHMMSESEYDRIVLKKRQAWLVLVMDLKKRWQEYVDECEHQDGIEYWDQFQSPEDAAEDFRLYESILDRVE